MSKANCDWLEEEIIDLALGKLSPERQRAAEVHLSNCSHCASVLRDWERLLAVRGEPLTPSPALKNRLVRHVRFLKATAWLKQRLRPLIAVPATVAALLILITGSLLSGDRPLPESAQMAKAEILKHNAMVNDPETVLHQVIPVVQTDIRGFVWINDTSDEMLLLAEGLDHTAEKDYQVWFVIDDNRSNVGVLQWRGRMAHLYVHSSGIQKVDGIAVSIEPKGGSFVPTGPDAMIVKIRHVNKKP